MIDSIELKRYFASTSNLQIIVYFLFMMTMMFTNNPLFKLCISIVNLIDFGFHNNVRLLLLFILYSLLSVVLMRFIFLVIFLVRPYISSKYKL